MVAGQRVDQSIDPAAAVVLAVLEAQPAAKAIVGAGNTG